MVPLCDLQAVCPVYISQYYVFLLSQQQSHVDSDPVAPKPVSGELLFSRMLPVSEQLSTPTLQLEYLLYAFLTCLCLIFPHSFQVCFSNLSRSFEPSSFRSLLL